MNIERKNSEFEMRIEAIKFEFSRRANADQAWHQKRTAASQARIAQT